MAKGNGDIVKCLSRDFYKASLEFSLSPEELMLMTLEEQQHFLDTTVNCELLRKYPVNNEFSRLFFKKLIGTLENKQEIHDDFYTYLCSAMNKSQWTESFFYRHYVIGNDIHNIVTIKETKNMVINGTTGMRTWDAALMLADWAICNKSIFTNKKVLELGSGVGFSGITIAKQCEINSILLTDCHTDVLRTICDNIKINFTNTNEEVDSIGTVFKDQKKYLGVMKLDWNNVDSLEEDIIPDILIGSDIVYDPSVIGPLCNIINTVCKRNKNVQVFIANIIRNEHTWKLFWETLGSMNLLCEEIEQSKSVFIEWDHNIKKCLLLIHMK